MLAKNTQVRISINMIMTTMLTPDKKNKWAILFLRVIIYHLMSTVRNMLSEIQTKHPLTLTFIIDVH